MSYGVALTRAQAKQVEIWPIDLPDSLPVVPVPVRSPDPDIPLDLQTALSDIYDEAAYDLTLDYSKTPPPPALSEADTQWIQSFALTESLSN